MSKLVSLNDMLTGNAPDQQQNQQPPQQQQDNKQGFGPVYIPQVNPQQKPNPFFPQQNIPQPNQYYPPQNNTNSHFAMAKNSGGNYAFPEEEINYVHSGNDGNYYTAIARSFKCAHFDNPKFFKKEKLPNSYTGGYSMTLIAVSWLDVFMNFNHVLAGNYQLCINQSFAPDTNVKNKLTVSVEINGQKISEFPNWPSDDIVKNSTGALKETYICNISREQFSKLRPLNNASQEYKVTLKISNTAGDWKNGWTIDGARLIAM